MTLHAFRAPSGVVYYLQRTGRDGYEIRRDPGRRGSRLVKRVESKAEWFEFVAGLKV